MTKLLLATDLDRTVLPNGEQPESDNARPLFRQLIAQPEITLAYISGRGKKLLREAIDTYDIPVPAFAIGDVGTSIFVTHDNSWSLLPEWQDAISQDWDGLDHNDMQQLFAGIDVLELQEDDKQNRFKLSYYTPENINRDTLLEQMNDAMQGKNIKAELIWSIDEQANTGLLDVLPKSATKLQALLFLQKHLGFDESDTVFCGDSGNDMTALTSGLKAVLVANARQDVKDEAQQILTDKDQLDQLYIAHGDFNGLNGNYSAGVLEGVAHFFPNAIH